MKHINLKDDRLILTFKFDPKIISIIRSIDGRIWNAKFKRWEVPKENVEEVLEKLEPLDFIAHLDVKRLKKQQEEVEERISLICKDPGLYRGNLPLYDFQKKGAAFMDVMDSALLGDVPGLGKTIQSIAATENQSQILIFCPATLKYSWEAEIKKWLPEAKILVVDGNKEERLWQWNLAKGNKFKYVIANYELLIHDFELINIKEWPVIICDEATRISNPEAKTVKNLKELRSKKRLALTGTPISNTPDDIYSIIDWLVPKYLGSFYQFRQKYCITDDRYNRVVGYKNMEELKKKVGRLMLRRTKEEVFSDFPKKIIEDITFHLSEDEKKMYKFIKEQIAEEIQKMSDLDTRTLGIIPVKMLRLKQCTGHLCLVGAKGESTKLQTLKELVKPILDSGEKVIVFTQFAEMMKVILSEMREYDPYYVFGEVDNVTRFETVKKFNDAEGGKMIVMTEAGAWGLNMQSASYVIHYDSPWSISKLMQREDRAHRIGRNKPVTVYNLVAKDTIDEYVLKILHKKQKVSVDILQDAERMAEAGMTMEDIKEILRI